MKSKNHTLRRGLVVATVVGALAAPTASAYPIDPPGLGIYGHHSGSPYSPNQPADQPTPAAADGFDWGDAGIGAAGTVALLAIAAGGAVAVGHHTRRVPGRPA